MSPRGRMAIAGGILTVCLVVVGATLMLWQARQTTIEEGKANLSNLSAVLAASTNQTMKAADLVLKSIVDRVHDADIANEDELRREMGTREIFDMLRNEASSVPQVADAAEGPAWETIAAMGADSSLPLEMARGSRALWYQRHAIASLVYMAELLRPFGRDLWRPRPDGADLHRAIAFLLDAIDDPERLAAFTGADEFRQYMGFLVPRGNGRHYMAWSELYRARFPERAESVRLLALLPARGDRGWPLIDDYVGGIATCRVLTVAANVSEAVRSK